MQCTHPRRARKRTRNSWLRRRQERHSWLEKLHSRGECSVRCGMGHTSVLMKSFSPGFFSTNLARLFCWTSRMSLTGTWVYLLYILPRSLGLLTREKTECNLELWDDKPRRDWWKFHERIKGKHRPSYSHVFFRMRLASTVVITTATDPPSGSCWAKECLEMFNFVIWVKGRVWIPDWHTGCPWFLYDCDEMWLKNRGDKSSIEANKSNFFTAEIVQFESPSLQTLPATEKCLRLANPPGGGDCLVSPLQGDDLGFTPEPPSPVWRGGGEK